MKKLTFVNIVLTKLYTMKFYLFYTTLLFVTYHLILCEDWMHFSRNNNEEEENEESKERQENKNFIIFSISFPWVKTSCQHLYTIPKSLLVQINKDLDNDSLIRMPFFCRVEVVKKMKIIGKVSALEITNVHVS